MLFVALLCSCIVSLHHVLDQLLHHLALSAQLVNLLEILIDLVKVALELRKCAHVFMQILAELVVVRLEKT